MRKVQLEVVDGENTLAAYDDDEFTCEIKSGHSVSVQHYDGRYTDGLVVDIFSDGCSMSVDNGEGSVTIIFYAGDLYNVKDIQLLA